MTEGRKSIAPTGPGLCLALAAMLLSAPLATSGQEVGFADAATVLDSNGQRIGSLQDRRSVFLKLDDNSLVAVLVGKDGFVRNRLVYSSPDCSGTPYDDPARQTEDGIPVLVLQAAVGPPGNTVYLRQPNAPAVSITVLSYLDGGQGGKCESSFSGSAQDVFPVVSLFDLNSQFTPPFRAVPSSTSLAQACGDCNADGRVTANEITQVVSNVFNESAGFSQRACGRPNSAAPGDGHHGGVR